MIEAEKGKALPCPHCGAGAELRRYQHDHTRKFYACSSSSCSWTYVNPSKALDSWNRRFGLDAIKANIESNKEAATNSPDSADWSNGVARGLELALGFLGCNDASSEREMGKVTETDSRFGR
jgi:hypothetical protein